MVGKFQVAILFILAPALADARAMFFRAREFPNLGLVVTAPNNKSERVLLSNVGADLETNVNFNQSLPTILFSYGFTDDFDDARSMMEAFQKRGGFNFIAVDWSDYNAANYLRVASDVKTIADIYGDALFGLKNAKKAKFSSWHFIGHSLGAHMVAFIARRIHKLSNQEILIQRLTGLDPAGPAFFDIMSYHILKVHLQKSDAKFVDIIHTDSLFYGTSRSIGHVDFWPNNGKLQPNCSKLPPIIGQSSPDGNCNHQRARLYYIESVATSDTKAFPSIRCDSRSTCYASDKTYMGFNVDPKAAEGNYYCTTSGNSPYNKGVDGIGI